VSNRVLVVDDEPVNIALVKAMLANLADEFLGVTDSTKAADAFIEFQPDIVLVDLHMPPPDGLELLRLWGVERKRDGFLPVIVMTGDDRDAMRNTALLLGANDFLVKPLDRQEVLLRARNLLHTRHLFQEVIRARGKGPQE
jgi:putative two-component system response regulator